MNNRQLIAIDNIKASVNALLENLYDDSYTEDTEGNMRKDISDVENALALLTK